LYINIEKLEIAVFRNSGKTKINEQWFNGNEALENVDKFTYLRVLFHYNNKFIKAEKQLADQSRNAMLIALRKIIRGMSINI
jgi:hypothetical protein